MIRKGRGGRWLLLVLGLPLLGAAADRGDVLSPALRSALARHEPAALVDPRLPRLATLDSAQRIAVARRLQGWPIAERVAALAFLQVGTPYRLGALGEEAAPDRDPLVRYDSTDCTVLQLVACALAHAPEVGGDRAAMRLAQYRNGHVSFADRLHFTTDRLDQSPWFEDRTLAWGGDSCLTDTVRLNRRADGGHWVALDWERTRVVHWLPRSAAGSLAGWSDQGRLPAAVGLAFVSHRTLADGLDVVHETLLWRGRTLLHASRTEGRVVTMPLARYLAGPGRDFDGFVLFAYR